MLKELNQKIQEKGKNSDNAGEVWLEIYRFGLSSSCSRHECGDDDDDDGDDDDNSNGDAGARFHKDSVII